MQSKLPGVGTTIFTVMSQLAHDCNAINLSQGFPSFNPDPELLDLVSHHLYSGANQYAPMPGVLALREALAAQYATRHARELDPELEITVCSGATEGLYSSITAVVRPGDEVIVFDPCYDAYEPVVALSGGITRHVPLTRDEAGEFSVDWHRLQQSLSAATRLIILNFPHNPTGAILSAHDLQTLASIIRDTDIFLISDEVYEHIIFDGAVHQSLLSNNELWQRSFVISSFGKTCHATGWKIGYCIAPKELTTELRKVHQFTCFAVSTPFQHALADYIAIKPHYYQGLSAFYSKTRDYFAELLGSTRFVLTPTKSTFFQIVDYSAISHNVDTEFASQMTRDQGVASIPISVFYDAPPPQNLLRFCFAKDDATLEQAVDNLCKL